MANVLKTCRLLSELLWHRTEYAAITDMFESCRRAVAGAGDVLLTLVVKTHHMGSDIVHVSRYLYGHVYGNVTGQVSRNVLRHVSRHVSRYVSRRLHGHVQTRVHSQQSACALSMLDVRVQSHRIGDRDAVCCVSRADELQCHLRFGGWRKLATSFC